MNNPIGMVLGTQDATPLEFWMAVNDGAKVQLDDIIMVEVPSPDDSEETIKFYGLVAQVRKKHEGVQLDSDTQMVFEGLMPANVSYAAQITVTRVDPEDFIPPGPGDPVYRAEAEHLSKALYFDNMERKLPCGVLRNDEAGYLNFDFISGEKGAHINISGISGVATKTSYALFLLHSIFNTNVLEGQQSNSKAIIFNVKGEDLLFLDRPNERFAEEEGKWSARRKKDHLVHGRFDLLDLPAKAFDSVGFFAPAHEGNYLMPMTERQEGVDVYIWTLNAFARDEMLPFVLTDRDSMSTLGFLVSHVTNRLRHMANKTPDKPYILVDASEEFGTSELDRRRIDEDADLLPSFSDMKSKLTTFAELVEYLNRKLLEQEDERWLANSAKGTREAFIRRMRGAAAYMKNIVRGDLTESELRSRELDILKSKKQVLVVDIHSLAPLAQMFVVGVLLKQLFNRQESAKSYGKTFVVLDELNKYAPAEGDSPIKDVLLDIAERGRSLGVILIGAQQTASEVERRIVSNAAVRVVGRLDAAEGQRGEYAFLPGILRQRASILAPGTMVVHQPDVPSPLIINFPFPAWATREAETRKRNNQVTAQDVEEEKKLLLDKWA